MTTSAANENRRPPFTTLATRLMETTRSSSPLRWSAGPLSYRLKSPSLPHVLRPPGPPRGRGTAGRRGRTPRARCRRPSPAARAARRPPWPWPSCRPRPSPRRPTRSRSCGPRRRRSAGRRRAGSNGRRPGAAHPRCRPGACAPGRAGGCARGASSRRPSLACLRGLAGLLPDELALVPNALALVRLGLADLADVGGDLADLLLVVAPDRDPRRRGDLELDALRCLDVDRVREPQRELQVRALQRRTVADADDLEALLVALGHALDHVRDERAGEPVQAAVEPVVGGPLHHDRAVVLADGDLGVERLLERAPRAA